MDGRAEATDLVRSRISLAAILAAGAFALIGARLADVMVFGAGGDAELADARPAIQTRRADLADRNGVLIARDLPVADLYATPSAFWDAAEAASGLAAATGVDVARLNKLFAPKRGYVLIKRGLIPDARERVMQLGLPGLAFENDFRRYYPSGRIAAHLVGLSDTDGNGVSGLELGLNEAVRSADAPVRLSIDMRVQFALQHEVAQTARDFRTKAAGGIVLDVHTGEVLAMVSLPDYEPNSRVPAPGDSTRNRMTQDVYELGSIFKVFAFAEAIEENTISLDELFNVGSPYKLGRFTINDYGRHDHFLPASRVFAESSNIGTAQIGLRSGAGRQQAFLAKMGLLSAMKTEVPEMAAPLFPRRWGEVETGTVSYGHGISVSPLSFAAAAAAVVNGGTSVTPTFLMRGEAQRGERVISEETSRTMRELMRLVVTRGTGTKAEVPGYEVGGKTGTAEKPQGRGYSRNLQITSFVAIFPASEPKYLVFTMFDEPIGNRESFGFATAGWTAAPAAGRVVARIAPLLGVPRAIDPPSARMAAAAP